MVTPSPTEQVKHQIRQIISRAFKQIRGKIPDDQWKDFESFFWKVRPLVEIDYSKFGGNINAETTGPSSPEKPRDESVPAPSTDGEVIQHSSENASKN